MFRTTTPLQRLRETYAMASLPDTIRTGELGEFGEPIGKPLSIATVDDISFALLRVNEEIDAHLSRANALRHLHDRARRAGATGAENAVEAALRFEERRKSARPSHPRSRVGCGSSVPTSGSQSAVASRAFSPALPASERPVSSGPFPPPQRSS